LAEPGVLVPSNVPVAFDGDDPNGSLGTSPNLFNTANSIVLLRGNDHVDAVGYSDATEAPACPEFSQGEGDCALAPLAATGDDPLSMSRNPVGLDTNNNDPDFHLVTPTPGAPNATF